jgi:hypothetical protein
VVGTQSSGLTMTVIHNRTQPFKQANTMMIDTRLSAINETTTERESK